MKTTAPFENQRVAWWSPALVRDPPGTPDSAASSAPAMRTLRIARRTTSVVRDIWLIFGVMLALLLTLEGGFRATGAIRRSLIPPAESVADRVHRGVPWYTAYLREREAATLRWKPFVYFRRRPSAGLYINVDEHGRRRTAQSTGSGKRGDVYFFGGSTMFGSFQRDSMTIPSVAARKIATEPELGRYEVTNFGVGGWVFTQSVLELIMELRAGARPAVVVFYDGLNDVGAAAQSGVAGIPYNETNRAREFDLGRTVFNSEYGLGPDVRALSALAVMAVKRLDVIERVLRSTPRSHETVVADTLAHRVANAYVGMVEVVEALSRQFGFRPLYVWQAAPHERSKKLTVDERAVLDEQHARWGRILSDVHQIVPALLDSSMVRIAPNRFVNQASLFETDTTTVFLDYIGHNPERIVPKIVDGFWPQLRQLLQESAGTVAVR